jgi:hypothetical protein
MADVGVHNGEKGEEVLGTDGGDVLPDPGARPCPTGTPDEQNFPRFAASFHKLFQHFVASPTDPDLAGLLTDSGVVNYENFRKALNGGPTGEPFDDCLLDRLTLLNRNPVAPPPCPGDPQLPPPPGPRVLINPRSSKAISFNATPFTQIDVAEILYRARNQRRRLLNEISLSSEYSAADLCEVYGQSLLRDETLGAYAGNADATLTVNALNSFGQYFVWTYDSNGQAVTAAQFPVTHANLFRGVCNAEPDTGPYLSGFLTLRRPPLFPSGCAAHVANLTRANTFARFGTLLEVVQAALVDEFGVTYDEYVGLQNSEIPRPYDCRHFLSTGVIRTGRHLGDYVHVDNSYEEYIRAADILIGLNVDRSPNSPYSRPSLNRNEGDGPTLGAGDCWALIGAIRGEAERAAWTQKYLVARRARPEVMAALVHLAKNDPSHFLRNLLSPAFFAPGPVFDLLEAVKARNFDLNGGVEKNYLLPQMYPEGSPAHPAWTSGHATIAGACVTVIKAIFNNLVEIQVPAFGGEPIVATSNVKCELDKVASNVAIGRDWGGVHYRSDGEHGILLGEQIAIDYLQNHIRTYAEEFRDFRGFPLIKRNGASIRITPDCVIEGVPYQPPVAFAAVEGAAEGPPAGQYPASNL